MATPKRHPLTCCCGHCDAVLAEVTAAHEAGRAEAVAALRVLMSERAENCEARYTLRDAANHIEQQRAARAKR